MSTPARTLTVLILFVLALTTLTVSAGAVSVIDDFTTLDAWTIHQGTATVNNNELTLGPQSVIYSDAYYSTDLWCIEFNASKSLGTESWSAGFVDNYNTINTYACLNDENKLYTVLDESHLAFKAYATTTNTYYHYKILKNSTGLYAWANDVYITGVNGTITDNNYRLALRTNTNYGTVKFKDFRFNDEGYNMTGEINMLADPVMLYTNATGTLTINATSTHYDEIEWYNNGVQIRDYKRAGAQWQLWNGTAWENCLAASAFTVSQYQDWAGTSNFYAWIKLNGNIVLGVNKNFQVIQNATQTTYYIRVVDNTGADLSTFTGHFFQSEDPAKDYTFNFSGYGAPLDLNRHYQGHVTADGYLNGSIAFQTTYNSSASVTYRTITVTMVGSDTPTDPGQAFLDVKIYDANTNEMIPDAIFTLTNTSGSKTYNVYGTVKRITIQKSLAYTWKASSSSYNSMTGTVNMTDGQAMLTIPLQPKAAATTTPTTSGGNIGGITATLTPDQRENQAMTMIDQLLEAGPSLMQLAILAVFMGLVMMLFPGGNGGRKRYYR